MNERKGGDGNIRDRQNFNNLISDLGIIDFPMTIHLVKYEGRPKSSKARQSPRIRRLESEV